MSVLLRFLMITIMVKKTAFAENKTVSAFCGESVVLRSGLQVEELEHRWDDIRWLHHRLPSSLNGTMEHTQGVRLLSLKGNETTCDHRRCKLLPDGSLNFSRVQTEDSGNYMLEMFYKNGTVRPKRDFELQVEECRPPDSQTTDSQTTHDQTTNSKTNSLLTGRQTDNMLLWICCLLLLLLLFIFIIIITFVVRRRSQNKHVTGLNEEEDEEVYVSMYGHHDNNKKNEKKTEEVEEEEESPYVPFNPAVSMERPITK